MKLTVAKNQLLALQSRNAANEQSVIILQDRLDKLLETHENIPEAEEHILEADTILEMSIQLQLEVAAVVKSVLQATEFLAQASELGSCREQWRMALLGQAQSPPVGETLSWIVP